MRDTTPLTFQDCSREVAALVGLSYSVVNCWDLVKLFYLNIYKIELKHYFEDMPEGREEKRDLIYSAKADFYKVPTPKLKFGDIIVFKIKGVESHIGVYLGEGKFLHSSRYTNSCLEKVSRWEDHISSCHRLELPE